MGYLPQHAAEHCQRTGRPLVTLSYAQSLDGCLTLRQGEPSPVSGAASMRISHELRATHDAILVGIGTVLADNPRLTARLVPGDDPRPIVLDSHLRTPTDARLLAHPKGAIIVTTEAAPPDRHEPLIAAGAAAWTLPADDDGRVSLPNLLVRLAEAGVTSLMVEGGAGVISSFLRNRLADRAVITIAPTFAGGYHAVDSLGFTDWASLPRLKTTSSTQVDDDLITWGDLV